jgi:GT2 family glycosyltransferase
VDNASGDDSVPLLRDAVARLGIGDRVRILPLDRNGGFAAGNNAAIREALSLPDPPEYLYLLNPDTRVHPGAAAALIAFLDSRPQAGVVGSALEGPDGGWQCAAFRFPSVISEIENSLNLAPLSRLLDRWRVASPRIPAREPTDWVSGASMMIRRSVFEAVSLLDDGFFLYFEELDFCRRVRDAGFEVWHEPAGRVIHLEGQSSGVTADQGTRRRPAYWFESRRRYWLKHHNHLCAALADAARICGTAVARILLTARGRSQGLPRQFVRDLVRHSVFVRGFQL